MQKTKPFTHKVVFTQISGYQKEKFFKSKEAAIKHYKTFINNMGSWYTIKIEIV